MLVGEAEGEVVDDLGLLERKQDAVVAAWREKAIGGMGRMGDMGGMTSITFISPIIPIGAHDNAGTLMPACKPRNHENEAMRA